MSLTNPRSDPPASISLVELHPPHPLCSMHRIQNRHRDWHSQLELRSLWPAAGAHGAHGVGGSRKGIVAATAAEGSGEQP